MITASQKPGEQAELDDLVALARRELSAGRPAEAEAAYRKILALRPDVAELHNDLGVILVQQGKFSEAVAQFEHALTLGPDLAAAHNNLANLLMDQGRLEEAAARFEHALILRPDLAEAHHNLANVLLSLGRLDEAAARFESALALRPDYVEAQNHLGVILAQQGKFDQALLRFEQAIALQPDYTEAHNHLGIVLAHLGRLDEAAAQFGQAIALQPDLAAAHNNLGNVLRDQGQFDQSAAHFEQSLIFNPDNAETHNNLGNALLNQGQLDRAAAQFEQALALRPDYPDAQLSRATCYLVTGDYERGWPMFEGRLRLPGLPPQPSLPRWTGQPLAGRSLLLLAEQGVGDTLHFLRYARLLKEQGARVVLACTPALGRFLASHPHLDELFILGPDAEFPTADFYLPLLSAPLAFQADAQTIPAEVPYVWADPALTEQWGRELGAVEGFKIGIVWQGARDYRFDRWRSVSLAQFAPLARLPGVQLISLQKGFGSEQISTADFSVLDLSGRLDEAAGPFMDTAAVIRNLDLVVTPNTAIAHLAGALGAAVFVALQFSPDWRWLQSRDDTPWYPTMRLFRQTTFGEWPDVFDRLAEAVQTHREDTA